MYALVNTKQGHCVAEWRSHGCEDKQSCASFSLGLARLALKVAWQSGWLPYGVQDQPLLVSHYRQSRCSLLQALTLLFVPYASDEPVKARSVSKHLL